MFKVLAKDGNAKRGEFTTVHGTIQTPVFMNVGTAAAIKGAVAAEDLYQIKTQVELSNTYHLHVRPGDLVVKKMGGIHKFMNWNKPILTDSGGFQVFSLAGLRSIKEEGVHFRSHIDGRKIFMGPEESMQIQSNLASTIAMASLAKTSATYPSLSISLSSLSIASAISLITSSALLASTSNITIASFISSLAKILSSFSLSYHLCVILF